MTYSNWESATICFGESFESLSEGLQIPSYRLEQAKKATALAAGTETADSTEGARPEPAAPGNPGDL